MSSLKDEIEESIEILSTAKMISEKQTLELKQKLAEENFYNWKG